MSLQPPATDCEHMVNEMLTEALVPLCGARASITAAEPGKRAGVVAATERVGELGRSGAETKERHAGAQGAAAGYAPMGRNT